MNPPLFGPKKRQPATLEEIQRRARRELEEWEASEAEQEDGFTTSRRGVLPTRACEQPEPLTDSRS